MISSLSSSFGCSGSSSGTSSTSSSLSKTSKLIYCLPQLTTNILNAFIGAHLTRFFVQDLCAGTTAGGGVLNHSSSSAICLPTKRFGTLSSIIGSLGLFLDLFLSSVIDKSNSSHTSGSSGHATNNSSSNRSASGGHQSSRQQHVIPIIAVTAPLVCFSAALLFNIEYPLRWIHTLLFRTFFLSGNNVGVGAEAANNLSGNYDNSSSSSMLITLSILFTVLSVVRNVTPLGLAYSALGPILTRDCSQSSRNSLFAYKHMSSLIGNLIGAFLPALIVYGSSTSSASSHASYQWQSSYVFYLSLLCVASYWFMCLHFYRLLPNTVSSSGSSGGGVTHAPQQQAHQQHQNDNSTQAHDNRNRQNSTSNNDSTSHGTKDNGSGGNGGDRAVGAKFTILPNMKQAFQNRAFTALLYLFVYEAARGILWGGLFPFYLSQVLGLDDVQYEFWGGVLNVSGMILAMIATPFWHRLSVRLGNYNAWLLSYVIQAPVGLLLYMCITVGQQQIYRYFFFFVILSITGSASGFLLDSIKANAIDYEELRTEERREASFEACWSLFPRYISLFSNAVSFGIVSYYNSPEYERRGEFSMESRRMIAILTSLLPSVTSFVCLYLMYRFPVNDTKHRQVLEAMDKLKNGESVIDPITHEIIRPVASSKTSVRDLNVLRHFSTLEIRWTLYGLQNRNRLYRWYVQWQALLEKVFFLFWLSVSSVCAWWFITSLMSVSSSDSSSSSSSSSGSSWPSSDFYATIYLWFSSVCFTIAFGYHYARMKVNPSAQDGLSNFTIPQLTHYLSMVQNSAGDEQRESKSHSE